MDQETPLRPECAVSGILCFVLHISRATGLAPLNFRSTGDGWRIRVSHYYSFYGEMVAVLSGIISITTLVIDMTLYQDSSLNAGTNANRAVWIVDVLIVSVLIIVGAYTGTNRMRHMIDCIVELEQLNEELKDFRQPTFRKDRKELIALSSLIFGAILIFTDYFYYVYKAVVGNGKVLVTSLYIFYSISIMNLNLLVIQFLLISMMILATLKELNDCFGDVLLDLQKNKSLVSTLNTLYIKTVYKNDMPTYKVNQVAQEQFYDAPKKILEAGVKPVPTRLNCLVRIYTVISDIIRKIDRSHGALLVMLFISFLLHFVITLYHLLSWIRHPYPENPILQIPWFIHQLSKLVMVIEPCHRTHDQLNNTKDLIARMTRYIGYDDYAIISEIKTFFRHLTLHRSRYYPMQFFTLNRTIVATMFGSITTYLIIVIKM